MLTCLPNPYPDELLYSVIARYFVHAGVEQGNKSGVFIFGRIARVSPDTPGCLDEVAARTFPLWGMTGSEIVERMTLLPYYSRYASKERSEQCMQALREGVPNVHPRLGLTASRIKPHRFLRFCPACRAADVAEYGETYWRRAHQLPGVLICLEHGEWLLDSHARLRPVRNYYDDATASTVGADATIPPPGDDTRKKLLAIGRRCYEILQGPIAAWGNSDLSGIYRRAAIERGFSERGMFIDSYGLENAFVSMYGEALLDRLGCKFELGNDTGWFRLIFKSHRCAFHPLDHALVQVFLEGIPVDPVHKILLGAPPWKCPDPYARHHEKFPIKKVRYTRRSGILTAHAKCTCGYIFSFRRTEDCDPRMPAPQQVRGRGPHWSKEAERLRQLGLPNTEISNEMGISTFTVARLLRSSETTKASGKPSIKDIQTAREEWTRTLDQVPSHSRSAAKKVNPSLYHWLYRHDREWLIRSSSRVMVRCRNRIDWERRDNEWAPQLEAAIKQAKKGSAPRSRITLNSVVKAGSLPRQALLHLHQMPKCKAMLDVGLESLDDYRERRLRGAALRIVERGLPRRGWILKELSGLKKTALSPRIQEVFDGLMAELSE